MLKILPCGFFLRVANSDLYAYSCTGNCLLYFNWDYCRFRNRTVKTGLPRQDRKNRTVRKGQDCLDRTAGTGLREQDGQERTGRTGLPGWTSEETAGQCCAAKAGKHANSHFSFAQLPARKRRKWGRPLCLCTYFVCSRSHDNMHMTMYMLNT